MRFRILKKTCHGNAPVYYAQRSVLGLWWGSCWYWWDIAVTYDSREKALDAIERFKLGCRKEVELL